MREFCISSEEIMPDTVARTDGSYVNSLGMLDIVTYLYATIFKEQLEIVPFKLS
jgi:hypothetical protein